MRLNVTEPCRSNPSLDVFECVLFFSGTTDVSFIDPVAIGRNAFSVTNDFVSGVAAYIQGALCAILDVILDTFQGTVALMTSLVFTKLMKGTCKLIHIRRGAFDLIK